MNKNQGKAYAALTLDLLNKMKITITPEVLAKQMDITYDLYDEEQAEKEYQKLMENNTTFTQSIKIAKRGGNVAGTARIETEKELGRSVVNSSNFLPKDSPPDELELFDEQ